MCRWLDENLFNKHSKKQGLQLQKRKTLIIYDSGETSHVILFSVDQIMTKKGINDFSFPHAHIETYQEWRVWLVFLTKSLSFVNVILNISLHCRFSLRRVWFVAQLRKRHFSSFCANFNCLNKLGNSVWI